MARENKHAVITRRRFLKGAALGGAGLATASLAGLGWPGRAAAAELSGPLTISNWPYYISPETVPAFEKRFGIQVNYIEDVNSNAALFGKIAPALQMGRNPDRDIVVPTDFLAGRMVQLGWLERFSHEQVPNAKNLVPALASPAWDPEREYSLPWATYLTGIAYNIEHTGRELTSINDIYDPAFKGHVSMLSQMRDTVALVLLGMGVNPEKATLDDMRAATDKIRKNVENGQIRQFFGNDYGAALARGDVWVAFAWSGDVVQLQKDNPNLRFLIPEEGLYRATDNMVIPLEPAHKAAALAWMNYVYDPEVYAQIAAYVQFIPPVAGTKPFVKKIAPELVDNPLIYPSEEVLDKTYGFTILSAEEEQQWQSLFQAAIGR